MESIRLNLTPTGVMPRLHCSQYDIGRPLKFVLYDGAQERQVASDETVTIHGCKPDNHLFTYGSKDENAVVSVSGSEVVVLTTEQMTAIDGDSDCELVISKNDMTDGIKEEVIGSINFILSVEKSPLPDDGLTSASDLETYHQMIESAKDSKEESAKSAATALQALEDIYASNGAEEMVLKASNWVGDNPPFTYDFGTDFKNKSALFIPSKNATITQIREWRLANIYGGTDTIMYARNSKPSMDIPVLMTYYVVRKELKK